MGQALVELLVGAGGDAVEVFPAVPDDWPDLLVAGLLAPAGTWWTPSAMRAVPAGCGRERATAVRSHCGTVSTVTRRSGPAAPGTPHPTAGPPPARPVPAPRWCTRPRMDARGVQQGDPPTQRSGAFAAHRQMLAWSSAVS
ncbi:hypothetical protein ACFQ3Z_43850 [Streptomyces nogalater]